MVALGRGGVSYERGTPVGRPIGGWVVFTHIRDTSDIELVALFDQGYNDFYIVVRLQRCNYDPFEM